MVVPGRLRPRRLPAHRRDRPVLAGDGRGRASSPPPAARSSASATASRCSPRPGCCPARCRRTSGSSSCATTVELRVETHAARCSPTGVDVGDVLRLPINHFEGNYVCDAETLERAPRRRPDRAPLRRQPQRQPRRHRRHLQRGRQRRRPHAAPRAGVASRSSAPPTAWCCCARSSLAARGARSSLTRCAQLGRGDAGLLEHLGRDAELAPRRVRDALALRCRPWPPSRSRPRAPTRSTLAPSPRARSRGRAAPARAGAAAATTRRRSSLVDRGEPLLDRVRRALAGPAAGGSARARRGSVLTARPSLAALGQRRLVLVRSCVFGAAFACRHSRQIRMVDAAQSCDHDAHLRIERQSVIARDSDRPVRSPDRDASPSTANSASPTTSSPTIVELLGREPTELELAMYAVMWSEHCSYKSSKRPPPPVPHRGAVGARRPGRGRRRHRRRRRPRGRAPHREPQPPVGGRAVPGRGHRRRRDHPRHLLDGCAPDRARWTRSASARSTTRAPGTSSKASSPGISGYGNAVGVPDRRRRGRVRRLLPRQPARERALPRLAAATSGSCSPRPRASGNLAVLLGSSTGRDGIGGASVLASAGFEEGSEAKRPSVQVGDPFEEKRLIEACLELLDAGLAVGVQDLGAAGHLVRGVGDRGQDRRGHGRRHRPRRQARAGHEPGRGDDVGEPGADARDRRPRSTSTQVLALCERWEIRATVVGQRHRHRPLPRLRRPLRRGRRRRRRTRRAPAATPPPERRPMPRPLADVPVDSLGDGPVYDRAARAARRPGRRATPTTPRPRCSQRFPAGSRPLGPELLALLATPTDRRQVVGVAPVRPPAVPQHRRRAGRRRRPCSG